jgi:beta-glucosidase-like glycosyl hydrolase
VIHDRSFGEDPEQVAERGWLMMRGLQAERVLACAKHFPGHGDTAGDSHLELPKIPHAKDRLNNTELVPFKRLIRAGVGAVMSAHLAVPAFEKEAKRASSLSRSIVTDLLEKELRFQGLKITDGMGMKALTDHYAPGELELEAFLAGNDILLCPLDVPGAIDRIEQAIVEGRVSVKELDRRVLKILKAKEWTGCLAFKPIDKDQARTVIDSEDACALKRQLYQEAITIVGHAEFDPIDCQEADKIAVIQIGGPSESAFKQSMQESLSCAYYHRPASADSNNVQEIIAKVQRAQTIIVSLFGMNKFVDQDYGISPFAHELLAYLSMEGKRIIVVPFGTPYSVSLLGVASSIVLAYEDDPDAQKAAAQVVLGTRTARGKLPVTVR